MDAKTIETLIAESLALHVEAMNDDACADGPEEIAELERVRTNQEAGILTSSPGLVLDMADGSQFQLEIVRSR